jgi:hypothetical protein
MFFLRLMPIGILCAHKGEVSDGDTRDKGEEEEGKKTHFFREKNSLPRYLESMGVMLASAMKRL